MGRKRPTYHRSDAVRSNESGVSMKLLWGDAFELLTTIEPDSVDAIITDPPYNISRDNNFASMGRAGIDFGEWDHTFC